MDVCLEWKAFFLSTQAKTQIKQESIRIGEAYEKMTERFISNLSQPAFISRRFFSFYDFSDSASRSLKLRWKIEVKSGWIFKSEQSSYVNLLVYHATKINIKGDFSLASHKWKAFTFTWKNFKLFCRTIASFLISMPPMVLQCWA